MINYQFASDSPKSFSAYPRGDFDLESSTVRKTRKPKHSSFHPVIMIKSFGNRVLYYYKLHPVMLFMILLAFGITTFLVLSLYTSHFQMMTNYKKFDNSMDNSYPFPKLLNLVMVAGHSIYTSSSCEQIDKEDSWFLESYQKNPGQASTFVAHIKEGIESAARDDEALLLFSGGETRKDAGPRSEAQSYWMVAESKGWFGKCF